MSDSYKGKDKQYLKDKYLRERLKKHKRNLKDEKKERDDRDRNGRRENPDLFFGE